MDRQKKNREGFTLIETLFVVALCVMMYGMFVGKKATAFSLRLFLRQMKQYCEEQQLSAMQAAQRRTIRFENDHALFDQESVFYPSGITCEPYAFAYNAAGNISKAGTLRCANEKEQGTLVFQLGSGRSVVR